MRVLLLHEFSGVHTTLAPALRRLGVDAEVATYGDLGRGYPTDFDIGRAVPGRRAALGRAARQFSLIPRFRRYDVIQSISPTPFFRPLAALLRSSVFDGPWAPKFIYLAAGTDATYSRRRLRHPYFPPLDWRYDPAIERGETRLLERASAIVAPAWEYFDVYREQSPRFIPFPIDTENTAPIPIANGRLLRVYHPLNRSEGNDFKGTSYIRRVFERLAPRLATEVEFVMRGGMSAGEYRDFVQTVDVVVDQAYSCTHGMSGAIALSMGQVVLGGAENVSHEFPMYAESPVINIQPNDESLEETLLDILSDRARIRRRGEAGRAYAEKFHDARKVAAAYLALYEEVTKRG